MKKFTKLAVLGLAAFALTGCTFSIEGGGIKTSYSLAAFIKDGEAKEADVDAKIAQIATFKYHSKKTAEYLGQTTTSEDKDYSGTVASKYNVTCDNSADQNAYVAKWNWWGAKDISSMAKSVKKNQEQWKDYTFTKNTNGSITAKDDFYEYEWDSSGLLVKYSFLWEVQLPDGQQKNLTVETYSYTLKA